METNKTLYYQAGFIVGTLLTTLFLSKEEIQQHSDELINKRMLYYASLDTVEGYKKAAQLKRQKDRN